MRKGSAEGTTSFSMAESTNEHHLPTSGSQIKAIE
jgi:hypothetical protein